MQPAALHCGSSAPLRSWHHGGSVTKVCFVPGGSPRARRTRTRGQSRGATPGGGAAPNTNTATPHPPPPRPRPPGGAGLEQRIRNARPFRSFDEPPSTGSGRNDDGGGGGAGDAGDDSGEEEEDDEIKNVLGGMALLASASTVGLCTLNQVDP
jgi:hypothetical protein